MFFLGKEDKHRKSIYDRLGVPVVDVKDKYKQTSATSQRDKNRLSRHNKRVSESSSTGDKSTKTRHTEKYRTSGSRRVYHDDETG